MKFFKIFGLAVFSLCVAFSCSDREDYSITIMSPDTADKMVGDMFHLHINFDESNERAIDRIHVEIRNIADGTVMYGIDEIIDDAFGHFEHHADVILDVEPHTDWILEARLFTSGNGQGDNFDEEVLETIQFHVHPN